MPAGGLPKTLTCSTSPARTPSPALPLPHSTTTARPWSCGPGCGSWPRWTAACSSTRVARSAIGGSPRRCCGRCGGPRCRCRPPRWTPCPGPTTTTSGLWPGCWTSWWRSAGSNASVTVATSSRRWAATVIWRSWTTTLADRHGGEPMTDTAGFTVADPRTRAGEEAFRAAGEHVVAIDGPDEDEWSLSATIELDDGRTLETILHHRVGGPLDGECDCPQALAGSFCSHLVWVGLAHLGVDAPAAAALAAETTPAGDLRPWLATLRQRELIELVIEAADENRDYRRRLGCEAGREQPSRERPPPQQPGPGRPGRHSATTPGHTSSRASARVGLRAIQRSARAILACPASRSSPITRLRRLAITCGPPAVRTRL